MRVAADELVEQALQVGGLRVRDGLRMQAVQPVDGLLTQAEGLFGGYEHMDAFPLLGAITAAECAAWLTETLAPERLALSVVAPKGGEDDADDDA